MYRLPGAPAERSDLPEGYTISKYTCDDDKQAWADCCKNGLVSDTAGPAQFDKSILGRKGLNPYEDVFFIDYNGEHIGTVTAYIHDDDGTGDMHMVGIKKEFRGRGLSKYLTQVTIGHLEGRVPYIHLTTDDWRYPAIKGYLRGGFLPVIYDRWMGRRWQSIATRFGVEQLQTLDNDGNAGEIIYSRSVLRFGAIGTGCAGIIGKYAENHSDAALCCVYSPDGGSGCIRDYDRFIASDFDCLILEGGTLLAIEAMKTGLNILNTGARPDGDEAAAALEKEIALRGQSYGYAGACTAEEDIRRFIASCKGEKTV